MIISRRVALAKIEVTQGTDAVAVPATDSVKVENLQFSWLDPRNFQPQSVKQSFGSEPSIFGGALGQYTMDIILKGSGTAGTPPEADPILRACGLGVTNAPATSDTYAKVSTGHESISFYGYDDGKLRKLLGTFGNATFETGAGQPLKASVTLMGHVVDETDTPLVTPTYAALAAPVYLNASFLSDSYAAKISKLTFDLGNEMAKPEDVSGADGWGDLQIVDHAVVGSFDPLDALVATYDWVAKWKADTQVAIVSGDIGDTAGNIITVNFPTAQYAAPGDGDREKLKALEIPFAANESTGDDELSIVFT